MQGCCLGCIGLISAIVVGAIAVLLAVLKFIFSAFSEAPIEILYVVVGSIALCFLYALIKVFFDSSDTKSTPDTSHYLSTPHKPTKRERRAEARAKAEAKKAAEEAAAAEKAKIAAMLSAPIKEPKIEKSPTSPYVKELIRKHGHSIFDKENKNLLDELLELDDSLHSRRLRFLSTLSIPQVMFECKKNEANNWQQTYNDCLQNLKCIYEISEDNGKILLNEFINLLGFKI